MTEDTFTDLFDWLVDRRGQRMRVSAGSNEGTPESPKVLVLLSISAMLGEAKQEEEGAKPGLTISLYGTPDQHERDELWLDPDRVTRVEFLTADAVRIWFEGGCFISLTGSAAGH